jgi:hypothetical protein
VKLKSLSKEEIQALPIGDKFFKINKLRIEFIDGQYTLWDSGITKSRGLIVCLVEKMSETSFRITGGQFNDSEQCTRNLENLVDNSVLIMQDKDELVRLWVDNAIDTLNMIGEFQEKGSHNALINLVWASNGVNNSKENRPELWI